MAPPTRELMPATRALLAPAFETYRLRPLDPDTDVRAHLLPGSGATQSRVALSAHLGFKEVRSRIAHNHLDTAGSRGVYVDAEWNVVGFELDDNLVPTFTTLAALPVPVGAEEQTEYPRALALTPTLWAIASGIGSVYVLAVSALGSGSAFSGSVVARYDVAFDSTVSPFQLCAAHVENNAARLLIARALSTSGSRARSATFELSELRLDLAHTNGGDSAPETVAPAWSLAGADLPYWASWDGGWVVLSEDAFTAPVPEQEKVETEEERGARERKEKEERLGLGATLPPVTASAEPAETPIGETETADVEMADETQYPFRWTQDTSSVTITMPVPPGTSRSALDVRLAPSSVTVSITGELEPPLSNFAGRTHALWTEIRADESTWTFDSSSNEIALELTKAEGDGTRWPSVFVPGEDDEDEEDFEDVPETFETATLDAVRASFASVRTRETGADTPGSEPRGNAPAVAALAREDMDLDWEDDEYAADGAFADMGASAGLVGRSVLVGFVRDASEGVNATWSRQPVAVLSLPAAPGATDLIVKSAVDGLRFAAPSEDPARTPWTHVGTTPALAFVMSSKRDLRLVRHVNSNADANPAASSAATVLAFDSGNGTGNGNVYIYYPPAVGGTTAQQGVVAVSGGERGALLGAAAADVGGRQVVLALTERALVVLGGVL